jgi:hypothetical protein
MISPTTNNYNKRKNENEQKSLGNILKISCIESTIHGFPKIVYKKNAYLKLMWILASIISPAICFTLISKTISEYLQYKVVTNVQIVYKDHINFPDVTLCNVNAFTNKEGVEFLLNNLNDSLDLDFNNIDDSAKYNRIIKVLHQNSVDSLFKMKQLNETTIKKFAFKANEIVLQCRFLSYYCQAEDFIWYFDPYHGNCLKLNLISIAYDSSKMASFGELNGFYIEMFVGGVNNSKNLNFFEFSSGIIMTHYRY